jgi:heterodisulfide reductase subunit B
MRYYSYFPGCSLKGTGVGYGLSIQAISDLLGIELVELEDWNCCGSTPFISLDELGGSCVGARNLALAERTGLELVTPCSSCYVTLNRVNSHIKLYPDLKANVDKVLAEVGLQYRGEVKVRHLLEVVLTDITLDVLKSKVVNALSGLKVAPYYGCQLVRPDLGFDNPEFPQSLDRLIASLGAEATPFPLKSRCCGSSLIIPQPHTALALVHQILESAQSGGAQCIVVACPLCQTNLDAYQGMVNNKYKTKYDLPVLFFTQLIGLALGIEPKALGLDTAIVSPEKVLAGVGRRT